MFLTAALPLLLSGCGMNTVPIFNDIKGQPYANTDKYSAGDDGKAGDFAYLYHELLPVC